MNNTEIVREIPRVRVKFLEEYLYKVVYTRRVKFLNNPDDDSTSL